MQIKINQENMIKKLLLLFFPVAGFTNYIASNFVFTIGKCLFTSYLVFLILILFKNKNRMKIQKWPTWPIFLVCIFSIGYFRAYFYDTSLMGLPSSFVIIINYISLIVVAKLASEDFDAIRPDKQLLSSFIFFFLINFILFVVGFKNPAVEEMYFEELETVFTFVKSGRQILPLSFGIIDSSIISLFAGVGAMLLFPQVEGNARIWQLKKLYYLLILILSIAMMILSGGRTVIAILFVIFLLSLFGLEKRNKICVIITTFAFFFPVFYLPFVIPLIRSEYIDFLQFLSRTGDITEVILLNNRVLIWGATLNYLLDNLNIFNLLFGYGYHGQAISGVVNTYSFLFSSAYANTETISVHSSVLQILVNYGFVGIGVYYYTILKTVLFAMSEIKYKIIMYLIVTCVLVTILELQLAMDSYLFMLFIFSISCIYTLKYKYNGKVTH